MLYESLELDPFKKGGAAVQITSEQIQLSPLQITQEQTLTHTQERTAVWWLGLHTSTVHGYTLTRVFSFYVFLSRTPLYYTVHSSRHCSRGKSITGERLSTVSWDAREGHCASLSKDVTTSASVCSQTSACLSCVIKNGSRSPLMGPYTRGMVYM